VKAAAGAGGGGGGRWRWAGEEVAFGVGEAGGQRRVGLSEDASALSPSQNVVPIATSEAARATSSNIAAKMVAQQLRPPRPLSSYAMSIGG